MDPGCGKDGGDAHPPSPAGSHVPLCFTWGWSTFVVEAGNGHGGEDMLSYSAVTCSRSKGVDYPSVRDACGALVPFLDMLNHDDEAAQVEWECDDSDDVTIHVPSKKHEQIYCYYRPFDNKGFAMRCGFSRMSNPADDVKIAWALKDGVRNVKMSQGLRVGRPFEASCSVDGGDGANMRPVYESINAEAVKAWWTQQIIAILSRAARINNDHSNSSNDVTMPPSRGEVGAFRIRREERGDRGRVRECRAGGLWRRPRVLVWRRGRDIWCVAACVERRPWHT